MTTLLSLLGTGSADPRSPAGVKCYRTAHYRMGDVDLGSGSFAAAALLDHLHIDTLVLIGTRRSLWDEAYRVLAARTGAVDEEVQYHLLERIEAYATAPLRTTDLGVFSSLSKPQVKTVLLPYGTDEAELTNILHTLSATLDTLPGDTRLYLDITHAFRSLPLYTLTVLDYLTNVRGRGRLRDIFYAMLEVSGERSHTPVVSLRSVLDIQRWVRAGYVLKKLGDGYELAVLLREHYPELADTLRQHTDALRMNNLQCLTQLQHQLPDLGTVPDLGVRIALRALAGFYRQFDRAVSQADLQLRVAKYHHQRGHHGMCYLVLAEALVTYGCEYNGTDPSIYQNREAAKKWLGTSALKALYKRVNKRRKRVAHQLDTLADPATDIAALPDLLDRAAAFIQPN